MRESSTAQPLKVEQRRLKYSECLASVAALSVICAEYRLLGPTWLRLAGTGWDRMGTGGAVVKLILIMTIPYVGRHVTQGLLTPGSMNLWDPDMQMGTPMLK